MQDGIGDRTEMHRGATEGSELQIGSSHKRPGEPSDASPASQKRRTSCPLAPDLRGVEPAVAAPIPATALPATGGPPTAESGNLFFEQPPRRSLSTSEIIARANAAAGVSDSDTDPHSDCNGTRNDGSTSAASYLSHTSSEFARLMNEFRLAGSQKGSGGSSGSYNDSRTMSYSDENDTAPQPSTPDPSFTETRAAPTAVHDAAAAAPE